MQPKIHLESPIFVSKPPEDFLQSTLDRMQRMSVYVRSKVT